MQVGDCVSDKKKQHYVPKFYLRNFSNRGEAKIIGLYNISGERYVPSGSLKNQAYVDYFYGKDGVIEEALSQLENVAAEVITNIIQQQAPPLLHSADHLVLLAYIVLSSSRTLYNAETMNELLDKQIKTIYKDDPRVKDNLDDVKLEHENPAAYSLNITARLIPVTGDLNFKLLVNRTRQLFVTSDNPVVRYNQFLEPKPTLGSNIGLGVKGFQMILPLSPETCILFYDPGVYKVGNKKDKVIYITDEKDIDELNILQVVNANSNLYFTEEVDIKYITKLTSQGKKYMRDRKGNVGEYPLINGSSENSTIIHMYNEDVKTRLKLTFISILKKAKQYELGNRAVHLRNPDLVEDLIAKRIKENGKEDEVGQDN